MLLAPCADLNNDWSCFVNYSGWNPLDSDHRLKHSNNLLHNIRCIWRGFASVMGTNHILRPESRRDLPRSFLWNLLVLSAWDFKALLPVQQMRIWFRPPLFVFKQLYRQKKLQAIHRYCGDRLALDNSDDCDCYSNKNQLCACLHGMAAGQSTNVAYSVSVALVDQLYWSYNILVHKWNLVFEADQNKTKTERN